MVDDRETLKCDSPLGRLVGDGQRNVFVVSNLCRASHMRHMIDAWATAVLPQAGGPIAWVMETSSRHEGMDYVYHVI